MNRWLISVSHGFSHSTLYRNTFRNRIPTKRFKNSDATPLLALLHPLYRIAVAIVCESLRLPSKLIKRLSHIRKPSVWLLMPMALSVYSDVVSVPALLRTVSKALRSRSFGRRLRKSGTTLPNNACVSVGQSLYMLYACVGAPAVRSARSVLHTPVLIL